MCSLQNMFSTECVLYKMSSLQNVFWMKCVYIMLSLAWIWISVECALYRMCSLYSVFSIQQNSHSPLMRVLDGVLKHRDEQACVVYIQAAVACQACVRVLV